MPTLTYAKVAMRGQVRVQPGVKSLSVNLKDFDLTQANELLRKRKWCRIFVTDKDMAQMKAILLKP
jgi:hypothetical protein